MFPQFVPLVRVLCSHNVVSRPNKAVAIPSPGQSNIMTSDWIIAALFIPPFLCSNFSLFQQQEKLIR